MDLKNVLGSKVSCCIIKSIIIMLLFTLPCKQSGNHAGSDIRGESGNPFLHRFSPADLRETTKILVQ